MATVIYSDGRKGKLKPANGKKFTLAEVESVVEGVFDCVRSTTGRPMYVRMRNLDINRQATALLSKRRKANHLVLGTAILLDEGEQG